MKYSAEDLESIADKLRNLPPVQGAKTRNKRQAVGELSAEIAELKRRGYTIDQISEALSDSGLEISTPTLKNYLHRAKSKAGKPARTTTGTSGGNAGGNRGGNGAGSKEINTKGNAGKQRGTSAASFEPSPDSDDI